MNGRLSAGVFPIVVSPDALRPLTAHPKERRLPAWRLPHRLADVNYACEIARNCMLKASVRQDARKYMGSVASGLRDPLRWPGLACAAGHLAEWDSRLRPAFSRAALLLQASLRNPFSNNFRFPANFPNQNPTLYRRLRRPKPGSLDRCRSM